MPLKYKDKIFEDEKSLGAYLMGSVKTKKKTIAAQINGKKGGRPPKNKENDDENNTCDDRIRGRIILKPKNPKIRTD